MILLAVKSLLQQEIIIDSSYYSMIAFSVSLALPYVTEIIKKNISVRCSIEVSGEEVDDEQE